MSQETLVVPHGFKYNPELIIDPDEDNYDIEIGDYIMIREYHEVAECLESLNEATWIHENYGDDAHSSSDFKLFTGIPLLVSVPALRDDNFAIQINKSAINDDIERLANPSFARGEVFRLGGPDYPSKLAHKQSLGNLPEGYALAKGRHKLQQEL